MPPKLTEVFGLSADPAYAYIDRGQLDAKLKAILESKVHAVVHGGSKQGKTWLRDKVLNPRDCITVQCQPNATVASLISEVLGVLGVRSVLVYTKERTLSGEIDMSTSAELGAKVLAKAKAELGVTIGGEWGSATESAPVGRTPGDLAWVSLILREAGKRVVLEDFHYLPAAVQRDFSFALKGLHGYGVFCLLIGVWSQTDLLTMHNGDLDGRVEEVRLAWSEEEFFDVLDQGGRRLNVEIHDDVQSALVAASYKNVGLLQRLTEQTLRLGGIERHTIKRQSVSDSNLVSVAQADVAERMRGRYMGFAQAMVDESAVYRDTLRAVAAATDEELLAGLPLSELPRKIVEAGGKQVARAKLQGKLSDIADLQQDGFEITPPILAWDIAARRLFVVEQTFLFYREHGSPEWPWEN